MLQKVARGEKKITFQYYYLKSNFNFVQLNNACI